MFSVNLPKPTAAIAPTMHGIALPESSTTTVVFTPTPMLNLTAAHLARSVEPPPEWPRTSSPPVKTPDATSTTLDVNNNQISELQKFANDLKMQKLARKRLAYKNRAAAAAATIGGVSTTTAKNLPPPHLVVKTSKLNVNAPVFVPKTTIAACPESSTTAVVAAPVTRQPSLGGIFLNENRRDTPVRKEEIFNARDIAFPPNLDDRGRSSDLNSGNIRQTELFNAVSFSSSNVRAAEGQNASSTINCQSFNDLKIRAPDAVPPPPHKIALVQNWNLRYEPAAASSSSSKEPTTSTLSSSSSSPPSIVQNAENCNAIKEREFYDNDRIDIEPTFTVASTDFLYKYDREQMFDVYRSLKDLGDVPRPTCLSREFDNKLGIFQPCQWIESEWRKDELNAKQNFSASIHPNACGDLTDRISQNGLRRALVNDQVNRLIKKGMTNFVSRQLVNAMTDQLKLNK